MTVDEFLEETGYTGSLKEVRQGKKIYKAIQREEAKMKNFLTFNYDEFLECVEEV